MRDGGNLVSQAHQLAGRAFARVLKRHGIEELSPGQGRILYALWREDGIAQGELARKTKLEKSTLALMLDRLEAEGLVERVPDPADARRRIVRATDATRRLDDAYARASEEMISIFYRGMQESEIDRFERALRRVIANLEADEAGVRGAP